MQQLMEQINTNTLTGSALTFAGANPIISPATTDTGLTLKANGTGTLALAWYCPTVINGSNFSVNSSGAITAGDVF